MFQIVHLCQRNADKLQRTRENPHQIYLQNVA